MHPCLGQQGLAYITSLNLTWFRNYSTVFTRAKYTFIQEAIRRKQRRGSFTIVNTNCYNLLCSGSVLYWMFSFQRAVATFKFNLGVGSEYDIISEITYACQFLWMRGTFKIMILVPNTPHASATSSIRKNSKNKYIGNRIDKKGEGI